MLFATARGNYSEGFDFKDKLCRGVIMIGVPNLNITSPKIKMKKIYLSEKYLKDNKITETNEDF